jgi:hypothetical protein
MLLIQSCNNNTSSNNSSHSNSEDTTSSVKDTSEKPSSGSDIEELNILRAEKLIGAVLPNLDDTTLLKLVYNSFIMLNGHVTSPLSPEGTNSDDSIYMYVEERLGDEQTQLIYFRGEISTSLYMHNHFQESSLLFEKVNNGWKIVDAMINEQSIDFESVELIGFFFHDKMLVGYSWSGVYGGGIIDSGTHYTLMSRNSMSGENLGFTLQSGNTASDNCFGDRDEGAECDCYERTGDVKWTYNKKLNYLLFDYKLAITSYDCEGNNPQETKLVQTWLMSEDTTFQIKGDVMDENEILTGEKIKLQETEIQKILTRKQ